MSNEATRRTHEGILQCIGRALRDRNESVTEEPIPGRWVQRLKELNEKEHSLANSHARRAKRGSAEDAS